MLDCNYSKLDIDAMVSSLDIDKSNKEKLRKTLRRFEKGLFCGGLGRLRYYAPAHIKLKWVQDHIRVDNTTFQRLMKMLQ